MEYLFEVKDLHKIYNTKDQYSEAQVIFEKESFTIDKESIAIIQGKSGCGKSSLLNLLSLLDQPNAGEIAINSEYITKHLPELEIHEDRFTYSDSEDKKASFIRNRCFGFIFQNFHLVPHLNVLENVMLPQLFSGVKNEVHASQKLEEVELTEKLNKYPEELSGGEKQRVAIARALIMNPSIIFADEPTGNLDSENAKIIIDLLENLSQEHKTKLIIVTHDHEMKETLKTNVEGYRNTGRIEPIFIKDKKIIVDQFIDY